MNKVMTLGFAGATVTSRNTTTPPEVPNGRQVLPDPVALTGQVVAAWTLMSKKALRNQFHTEERKKKERRPAASDDDDETPAGHPVHTWPLLAKTLDTRLLALDDLLKLQNYVQQRLAVLKDTPLATILIEHMQIRGLQGKNNEGGTGWKPQTLLRHMTSISGALTDISIYAEGLADTAIKMSQTVSWKSAIATIALEAMYAAPEGLDTVTAEEIHQAIGKVPQNMPQFKIALVIMWHTACRVGDVLDMYVEDVKSFNQRTGDITFMIARGKGCKLNKGKHAIHTVLDESHRQLFADHMMNMRGCNKTTCLIDRPGGRAWSSRATEINKALKAACPGRKVSSRSIRRGSLQAMSKGTITGECVSEATMMSYSGHKSLATLRRYLDWGTQAGALIDAQRAAASELQRAPARR